MRPWFYSLTIFFLTIVSLPSLAQLYESQGQALIEEGDITSARTLAMENALKKALLVAGASVSSVQQVVNGLLTQDEISIRASGNVHAIELIDEIHTNKMITVTIRADIFPEEKQCFSADFRKSILLTRSQLIHREQANVGEIYPLDSAIINKLANKLNHQSQYIDSKLFLKQKTRFSRLNQSMQIEKLKQLAISLADKTDSQYVLFTEITDLSFNQAVTNSWQFWQANIYQRNFAIETYLYHGSNGELSYQKSHQTIAPWGFNKRQAVDVNSQNFWQSQYGQAIDKTLAKITKALDNEMMCAPSRAKIVQVAGNQITLNLGTRHGVKVGDEFELLHKKNFKSDAGITYAGFNVSSYKVKVTQVNVDSAIASTSDQTALGNIQIHDLAVRH